MKKNFAVLAALLLACGVLCACSDSDSGAASAQSDSAASDSTAAVIAEDKDISALQNARSRLHALHDDAAQSADSGADLDALQTEAESVLNELDALDFAAITMEQSSRLLDSANDLIDRYTALTALSATSETALPLRLELTLKNNTDLAITAVGLRSAGGEEAIAALGDSLSAGSVANVCLYLSPGDSLAYTLFVTDETGAVTDFSGELAPAGLSVVTLSGADGSYTAAAE